MTLFFCNVKKPGGSRETSYATSYSCRVDQSNIQVFARGSGSMLQRQPGSLAKIPTPAQQLLYPISNPRIMRSKPNKTTFLSWRTIVVFVLVLFSSSNASRASCQYFNVLPTMYDRPPPHAGAVSVLVLAPSSDGITLQTTPRSRARPAQCSLLLLRQTDRSSPENRPPQRCTRSQDREKARSSVKYAPHLHCRNGRDIKANLLGFSLNIISQSAAHTSTYGNRLGATNMEPVCLERLQHGNSLLPSCCRNKSRYRPSLAMVTTTFCCQVKIG